MQPLPDLGGVASETSRGNCPSPSSVPVSRAGLRRRSREARGTLPEKAQLWYSVDQREEAGASLRHMSARGRPVCQEHTAWSGSKPQTDDAYISLCVWHRGPELPRGYGKAVAEPSLEEGQGPSGFVEWGLHTEKDKTESGIDSTTHLLSQHF